MDSSTGFRHPLRLIFASSKSLTRRAGEGIEVRLRLAEGIGIQHFNSGSAYSMMRPGEESEARQPSAPN